MLLYCGAAATFLSAFFFFFFLPLAVPFRLIVRRRSCASASSPAPAPTSVWAFTLGRSRFRLCALVEPEGPPTIGWKLDPIACHRAAAVQTRQGGLQPTGIHPCDIFIIILSTIFAGHQRAYSVAVKLPTHYENLANLTRRPSGRRLQDTR